MPASSRSIAWLLPLCLVACEDRVEQCNRLIGPLNPYTEAMIHGMEGLARVETDPTALDQWLEVIDAADKELGALEFKNEELAGFAQRYQRQLADARKAATTMRDAAKRRDVKALHAAAKQGDAFLEAQATLVEELNAYCTTP